MTQFAYQDIFKDKKDRKARLAAAILSNSDNLIPPATREQMIEWVDSDLEDKPYTVIRQTFIARYTAELVDKLMQELDIS